MQRRSVATLTAVVGLLAASVSAWFDARPNSADRFENSDAQSAPSVRPWAEGAARSLESAQSEAAKRGVPLLIAARMEVPECTQLEAKLAANDGVCALLQQFAVLEINVETSPIAAALNLNAAPLFVILAPDGSTMDALVPLTGARFEPFGFAAELERVLAGDRARSADGADSNRSDPWNELAEIDRLECRGAYALAARRFQDAAALESRPTDPLARVARLRDALANQGFEANPGDTATAPADREGGSEAQLLLEDNRRVLFRGWSALASVLRTNLERAEANDGSYRGVPVKRWHRRLRDALRRAWRGAPDDALLPYGALLTTTFAARPDDLDSLDRAFCKAVLRTMTKTSGADDLCVKSAAAAVDAMRRKR